jgi:hypothetical protein
MYGKTTAKESSASQDPKAPQAASLKIKIGAKAPAGADGADETPTVRSAGLREYDGGSQRHAIPLQQQLGSSVGPR